MVQVNPNTSSVSVVVNPVNNTNTVISGQQPSYYTLLARDWAISPDIVQNTDYSAKYYAELTKSLLSTKANLALDNLSEAGELRFTNKASIDLDNLSTTGLAVLAAKANTDLDNLSTTGAAVLAAKASTDLDNLSTTGKARIAIKEYLDDETYAENDIVVGFVDDRVVLYKSLIDDNTDNPLSDTTCWEQINLGGSSLILGQTIESPIPLIDACLHLQDGALINGEGIYTDFVEEIINKFENSSKNLNLGVYGSPIINNGVVSGFSASPVSCVTTGADIPTSFSTFEIDLKFTTGSDFSNAPAVVSCGNQQNMGLFFGFETSKQVRFYLSSNGTSWDIADRVLSTQTVADNTTYYAKVYFTGTAYKVDLSTDGENYTNYITVTSSTAMYKPSWIDFGVWYDNGAFYNAFAGSIDFNYFKLIQDNKEVRTGMLPSWCRNESQWQYSNLTYGECGKFVVDTINNTVRIPKRTSFSQATVDESKLGDLIEAGLPNIIATSSARALGSQGTSGAFYVSNGEVGNYTSTGTANVQLNFDASLSNAIYGSSNTVQPQSVKVYYYIVVATSTKLPAEVVIDNVITDLNGKADVDGTNATFPHIIETYQNGASGYVLYSPDSNGRQLCIQWGQTAGNGMYGGAGVVLLKPLQVPYTVSAHIYGGWSNWYYDSFVVGACAMTDMCGVPYDISSGAFGMQTFSPHLWRAIGWLA